MTTASAPAGIGAPVMIRITAPGGSGWPGRAPAMIAPTTGSSTGAAARSAVLTANPSMAELSHGGSGRSARIAAPRMRPRASRIGTSSTGRGRTRARIRRLASATLSMAREY
jgi:hypothetical protein